MPTEAARRAWDKSEFFTFDDLHGNTSHQSWIYHTWVILNKAGIFCQLVNHFPKEGIIIGVSKGLRKYLPKSYIPSDKIFLVDVLADRTAHHAANLHLVQNKSQTLSIPNALFMPHWPQPHLIKRDPLRGDRFEKIAFFGNPNNITSELYSKEWNQFLYNELGVTFHIHEADRWHDYSNVDCVIAIRDFSTSLHLHKPSTKLYNAWHAGIPFVGGLDSAYTADGLPGKNYLVATSLEEVFSYLKQLKENSTFRANLVAEGEKAAVNFTQTAILEHWRELIQTILPRLAKLKAVGLRG